MLNNDLAHWPSLERYIKPLAVISSTARPHTTLHWMHSSWNICERDNGVLTQPTTVLTPVKERSRVCIRTVNVIQLFRNVQSQNPIQTYPLLLEMLRRCVSMSSHINNQMIKMTLWPKGLISLVTAFVRQTKNVFTYTSACKKYLTAKKIWTFKHREIYLCWL